MLDFPPKDGFLGCFPVKNRFSMLLLLTLLARDARVSRGQVLVDGVAVDPTQTIDLRSSSFPQPTPGKTLSGAGSVSGKIMTANSKIDVLNAWNPANPGEGDLGITGPCEFWRMSVAPFVERANALHASIHVGPNKLLTIDGSDSSPFALAANVALDNGMLHIGQDAGLQLGVSGIFGDNDCVISGSGVLYANSIVYDTDDSAITATARLDISRDLQLSQGYQILTTGAPIFRGDVALTTSLNLDFPEHSEFHGFTDIRGQTIQGSTSPNGGVGNIDFYGPTELFFSNSVISGPVHFKPGSSLHLRNNRFLADPALITMGSFSRLDGFVAEADITVEHRPRLIIRDANTAEFRSGSSLTVEPMGFSTPRVVATNGITFRNGSTLTLSGNFTSLVQGSPIVFEPGSWLSASGDMTLDLDAIELYSGLSTGPYAVTVQSATGKPFGRAIELGTSTEDGSIIADPNTVTSLHLAYNTDVTGRGALAGPVQQDSPGTITASAKMTIGRDVSNGVQLEGVLNVGPNEVVLLDANEAQLGEMTTIDGGLLRAENGMLLDAGRTIDGYGVLIGPISGTGSIVPNGTLSSLIGNIDLGFATSTFLSQGQVVITRRAGNILTPGQSTLITLAGGTANVPAGLHIDRGVYDLWGTHTVELRGHGTVNARVSGTGRSVVLNRIQPPATITASGGPLILGDGSATGFVFGGDLAIGAETVTLKTTSGAQLGNVTSIAGGQLFANGTDVNAGGASLNEDDKLTGFGTIFSRFGGTTLTTLEVKGGDMLIGHTSSTGFSTAGNVSVEAGRKLSIIDTDAATIGGMVTLSGGTIEHIGNAQPGSYGTLALDGTVTGSGTISARVTQAAAGVIIAGGDLTLGKAGDAQGVVLSGTLNTGANKVTFLDSNQISLPASTSLGGGTIESAKGYFLGVGDVLTGSGTVIGHIEGSNNSRITATGALTLNNPEVTATFLNGTTLEAGANTITIQDAATVNLGPSTTLAGGAIVASAGLSLPGSGAISGFGSVDARLSGSGTITANGGTLRLGDPASNVGMNTTATLNVGDSVMTLRDSTAATFNIANLSGGTLTGANGLAGNASGANKTVNGYGLLRGALSNLTLNPTGSMNFVSSLNVGADVVTVLSNVPSNVSSNIGMSGGRLYAAAGLNFTDSSVGISGNGAVFGPITNLSPGGGSVQGTLPQFDSPFDIGNQAVTLFSNVPHILGGTTTIAGGTLACGTGISMPAGASLTGFGTIAATVSSASTGSIAASGGDLTLGRTTSASAVNLTGPLSTGANTVTLLNAGSTTLGLTTTLGTAGQGGVLRAANGLQLLAGRTLSGRGSVEGAFSHAGSVNGNLGTGLVFKNLVTGTGSFGGAVTFEGGLSPGSSGGTGIATVNAGSIALSATNTLMFDLSSPATFDSIVCTGAAQLGGTVKIVLRSGYIPVPFASFQLITAGSYSGNVTFDLPSLPAGSQWDVTNFSTGGGIFVNIAPCPGDNDCDGVPNAQDLCPSNPRGYYVNSIGCPLDFIGDVDEDGDVDQADLLRLTACRSGPRIPHPGGEDCLESDVDHDGDVDQDDFGSVQRCYSGSEVFARFECTRPG